MREAVQTIRAMAQKGDNDAFFELVAREPSYLFTSGARARISLWHLQKELWLEHGIADDGAVENLRAIGRALSRTTRERFYDASSFERTLDVSRSAVTKAAMLHGNGKLRRHADAEALAEACDIATQTATEIITSARRKSSKLKRAVEIEVGARLNIERERVRQLKRRLERVRADGWIG